LSIRFERTWRKSGLIASATTAVLMSVAAHAKEPLPLCQAMTDVEDVNLRDAASAVFGSHPTVRSSGDSTSACVFPAAALEYSDARVLITGTLPGGEVYPVTAARLSAFFLRPIGGHYRLVTVRRNFADGRSGMGRVGSITAIHFGDNYGMMVEGDGNGQGYDYGSIGVYVFLADGIQSLGTIPTSYNDSGAVEKERITEIDGKVEIGQPQSDQVRVTYSVAQGGKMSQQVTIWRSQRGQFIPISGSVPKELEP
jgi:hypothetical protein